MKKSFLIFIITHIAYTFVLAQDNPNNNHEVTFFVSSTSILDIEGPGGNNSVNFTPSAITEAGTAFSFDLSNSELWLNYTNVKSSVNGTRKITVGMTNDLPAGMTLTVKASAYAGSGHGLKGTPSALAILLENGVTSTIITGIGSAFTGDGINNGHQLTYNLSFNDDEFHTLTTDMNESVTITYTIVDE